MVSILEDDEIHVWVGALDFSESDLALAYQLLDDGEKQRADRFLVEPARRQFIASHYILRQVLASYLDCSPGCIKYAQSEHGKPYLIPPVELKFSLSHSHQRALIAVTMGRELGVDVEHQRSSIDPLELAERFFAPSEFISLKDQSDSERLAAFYRIWSRKEAFIKATGLGLTFGLNNFEVSLQNKGMDCLLTVNQSAKLARQWSLCTVLEEETAYATALAVFGQINSLSIKHYSIP